MRIGIGIGISIVMRIGIIATIFYKFNNSSFSYIPNEPANKLVSLGDILSRQDLNTIQIPGSFEKSNDLKWEFFRLFRIPFLNCYIMVFVL